MIQNHITNLNDKTINKIYKYSDYVLDCILKQTEVEPIEKFNLRNRKSVIIYDN